VNQAIKDWYGIDLNDCIVNNDHIGVINLLEKAFKEMNRYRNMHTSEHYKRLYLEKENAELRTEIERLKALA
jgi:hypothetical protein